jgi:hypothetical protein
MTAVTLNTIRHNADGTITEGTITVDPATAVKRVRPNPTTISSLDFFNRFTDAEHAAIWAAATSTPAIGAGLTKGLAAGRIDLTAAELKAWVDGLVSVGVLTADRETAILTP